MDRNRVYEIVPLSGVSEVKFGMSANDVESVWGPPARKSKNFLGNRTEVRDAALITYDKVGNDVAEVGFPSSYSHVVILNVEIFQQPHARTIEQLKNLDPDAYEGDGFIVFKTLGISLSGFRGDDFSALTVTAFKDGWWDDSLKDMMRLD